MTPGIYSNITNEQYHGGPGISKSGLDLIAKSPLHYLAAKTVANDNAPTPAQAIGTAFHALLLEPHEFVKDYCLALRPQDVEGEVIESKDQLLALVEELNKGRLPKLATSGSKDELVARLTEAHPERWSKDECSGMTAADLKAEISRMNERRTGLLSTSGTMETLAQTLRDAGRPVTLWQDVKAEWLANNGHRKVLPQETWDQLHRMRDAVMAHPAARALMTNCPGKAEQSVYWIDVTTGELCRCRPDFWRDDGVIVDLKTTDDASLEGFMHSISKWRYHVQAPYYMDGIALALMQASAENIDSAFPKALPAAPKAFAFLAVEKSACVVEGQAKGVAVYVLNQDSMDLGRAQYRIDLQAYAECKRTNVWPGYGDKIQNISVPQWALAKNARLLDAA